MLLAGVTLDRAVLGLSGGERRRCSLAALLLGDHDLIVLDEPTNHLDVEAVAWLAGTSPRRPSALVVVTHDRWFLDAVCQWTWEVHDGAGGRLRGRLRGVRARQGRAPAAGRGHRGAPAEPGPQGARLAAPRPAGADLEAEVPHRRGQRAHRGRARRRATGSSCSGSRPSGSARTSSTSRTSTWCAASATLLHARHLAARSGRPGRHRRRQRRRQDLGARAARRRARRRRPGGCGTAARSRCST